MNNSVHVSFLTPDKEGSKPLLEDDEVDTERKPKSRTAPRWALYAILAGSILTILISNVIMWHHLGRSTSKTPSNDTMLLTCGKTPKEARSLGCELDVMVYAWTPPACLNNTHALAYFHSQEWPFWRYENRTEEIPAADILAGKYEGFFSIWLFHGAHCQYLLSRNLQVLPTGGPLNDYMHDREHNTHCFDEVREPTDPRRTLEVGMAYSTCTVSKS